MTCCWGGPKCGFLGLEGGRVIDQGETELCSPPTSQALWWHSGSSGRGAGAGPGLISSKAREHLCSWEGGRTLPTLMPREQGGEKGDGRAK